MKERKLLGDLPLAKVSARNTWMLPWGGRGNIVEAEHDRVHKVVILHYP